MRQEVTISGGGALVLQRSRFLDENAAAVYLARLAPGSRRTMRQALDTIAGLVSGGNADALALDWSALRFQHTAAIRAKLAEGHAANTVNKMLSALRRVLWTACAGQGWTGPSLWRPRTLAVLATYGPGI